MMMFRLMYWSTRKKRNIFDPYGTADFEALETLRKARKRIEGSKDIYKTEVWERVSQMEREKVVEEFHGNKAHLDLRNARMDSKE